MKNESGIYPAGNRVLVHVDQIEEKVKDTMIELLPETVEQQQSANASGTLIAIGADAFSHVTEKKYRNIDGELRFVEATKRGYSKPFAEVGDRISFAKYSGMKYLGKDNKRYLVINDEDITCKIDKEVELSDLKIREAVSNIER